jgi:hypothetical protein|tara:strand:+ start:60 stop:368 length:309 start_codon:yes stop_codon:yes gene_type:complete
MKITRRQLANLIKEQISRALLEAEARPGPLGIAVDTEPPSIYEDDNSGEQGDLEAEEEYTGADLNNLRSKGTSPEAATARNIDQRKLAMMTHKSSTDADVIG